MAILDVSVARYPTMGQSALLGHARAHSASLSINTERRTLEPFGFGKYCELQTSGLLTPMRPVSITT